MASRHRRHVRSYTLTWSTTARYRYEQFVWGLRKERRECVLGIAKFVMVRFVYLILVDGIKGENAWYVRSYSSFRSTETYKDYRERGDMGGR